MTKKEKMLFVINNFEKRFPDAKISLDYNTEYQLMVAVVLSAQCTDKRVNIITKKLFEVVKDPIDIHNMDIKVLEEYIKSAGFYHSKAKNLKLGAKTLVEDYNGILPQDIEKLTSLGGVGRKTANVLLHELWNIDEGIVVDTHVKKLSNLLGFSKSTNPIIIERDLMKLVPKKYWGIISHYMILHGRLRCISKKLECDVCDLIREKK
ncbi:endonuclease III [Oceanivirga miroungae]|uniref:Endonuclease III n=1 Tax=Oceanivirga miroungae TaxID=1130046 RepID=A0A6I8MAZ4_9FUSO|nr:endonuclease III [Oceanivirga miroungae]VWL85925.1 endonuclease III [Oceanivirga miroungae]